MVPFLSELASLILRHHADHLDEVAVVLPNRRAGMHLRRYLAQAIGKPFWSPQLLDLPEFLERTTGLRRIGGIEALLRLHRVHVELAGAGADDLSNFLSWAPATLRDLSEVDAHLLDHADLYRDLTAYHEIEEWSFRLEELGASQQRARVRWRETGELHAAFNLVLEEEGLGTLGALARTAAGRAQRGELHSPWRCVWFAGHNALEPAIVAVIGALTAAGKARVAWDSDRYFLDDPAQEAGVYLRRAMARLGPGDIPPVEALLTRPRRVWSAQVPTTVAQASYAAQLIHALSAGERSVTAVVLADGSLLMPLLEALPADTGPVNVTMGIPLRSLPVHGLAEAAIACWQAFRADGRVPIRVLERLLMHPFLHAGEATVAFVAALRRHGDPSVRTEALRDPARWPHYPAWLKDWLPRSGGTDPADARPAAAVYAVVAAALPLAAGDDLRREQLFHLDRLERRIAEVLSMDAAAMLSADNYLAVRARLLAEEQVGLFGEPLAGTQVMGLLETRAIDFSRVIVLGAQEGTLPRAGGADSWIPMDVRRTHGLPMPGDAESIGAYLLHRLAQGASEIHLVWSADEASEPSRFIAQWSRELVPRSATTLETVRVRPAAGRSVPPPVAIAKDQEVQQRIHAWLAGGVSPSALGAWLRCPLDFCFRYLLRIRPAEEVDHTLGNDVLGEAVHAVLQAVYAPVVGEPLTGAHLLEAGGTMHDRLRARLLERYSVATVDRGYFRLRIGMAAQALSKHLGAEAVRCAREEVVPIAVELPLDTPLAEGVRITGRCDRVETRDGLHCIIDLKTGTVDPAALKLDGLEPDALGPRHAQALQLLVYAWAYLTSVPEVDQVRAGIVPLRTSTSSDGVFLQVGGRGTIRREDLPAVAALLLGTIARIRDPEEPFRHDPHSTWCACCVPAGG